MEDAIVRLMENNLIFAAIILVFFLIYSAYAVVIYVLAAKSLHMIAGRRGIKNPWLAWVPVANYWVLGSISDQYKMRKYGYDPELRRTLLILGIVSQAGAILINSINLYNNTIFYGSLDMAPIFLLLIVALIVLGVAIANMIYQYKALYDLYASCKPRLAVLFLVLAIVTPAGPFLIYACRDSDDGMPVEKFTDPAA